MPSTENIISPYDPIEPKEEETSENDAEVKALIEKRREAKKNKDFELADSIRADLLTKGIELIDTREGTTYKIIK